MFITSTVYCKYSKFISNISLMAKLMSWQINEASRGVCDVYFNKPSMWCGMSTEQFRFCLLEWVSICKSSVWEQTCGVIADVFILISRNNLLVLRDFNIWDPACSWCFDDVRGQHDEGQGATRGEGTPTAGREGWQVLQSLHARAHHTT